MENKRKRIGVIGYWFATNYGGVASYFSLYNNLREWGYQPFLVENPYFYTDKEGEDVFSRNFFKEIHADICEPYTIEELNKLNEKADVFVLGSDQVLTRSSLRAFGKLFLMEFSSDDKKRIAISASCGGDNLEGIDSQIEYIKKQFLRFSKISIREFAGLDVVQKKFGVKDDFMIDPIFFTKREDYIEIGKEEEQDPYILAYILDPTEDKREGILRLAEWTNLKVKVALDGRKFTHEQNEKVMNLPEMTLPELDFKQWLHYYVNASYIITDSFHGTAMALILNKPVIAYANYKRGYPRFQTLIRIFDIGERLIERTSEMSRTLVFQDIDFRKINQKITDYKEHAKQWIISGLEMDKKEIGSIRLPKTSVNTLLPQNECVGCGACVNICPKDAVSLIADEVGYYRAKVDWEKCIDCGLCAKTCPALQLPQNNNSTMPKCYEFIANDKDILWNSSSGGAFSVFSKNVLEKKGVIVGAAWADDFSVHHIIVDRIADLYKLQKSKYLQSYIGYVFRQVKEYLEKDREVLFTGCPCQVAGLRAYLGKDYDNLISVDLLCGNAPSAEFFKKYLKEAFPDGIKKYEFRNKSQGYNAECIEIEKNNGEKVVLRGTKQDAYQRVYHNHTMCASHCENCKYQRLPRFGDITIGDFWGLSAKDKKIDVSKGVSVILANSKRGEEFLKEIPEEDIAIFKEVPLDWLGGNGFAIKGSHNYASPERDSFYSAVQKMSFSRAVNYALKPNHGIYNVDYEKTNTPLAFNSNGLHFSFDPMVWEEHVIEGKPTLFVHSNQWKVHRYANLSLNTTLKKGKEYMFSIRFKLKSAYPLISFHVRDSGSGCIQIIHSFQIPKDNVGNKWYEVRVKFIPDTDLYDQFMIGASQVSGQGNFFMLDYVNIVEV